MKDKLIGITCSCGGAVNFVNGRLKMFIEEAYKVDENRPSTSPRLPNIRVERVSKLLKDSTLDDVVQEAKRVNLWAYATRSGAGSDKFLIIPELNKWVNLRDDIRSIVEQHPDVVAYVYKQALDFEKNN